MAKPRPAQIYRGDTWLRAWAVTADGAPIDTTGASARLHLKRHIDDQEPVLEASSTTSEITFSQEAASEQYPSGRTIISMAVPKEDTAALEPGRYVFDLEYTFGSGVRKTYEQNALEVLKDATA